LALIWHPWHCVFGRYHEDVRVLPYIDSWCYIWYYWIVKKEKLLQKALNSPQNLRFSEFKTLLEHFEFYLMNSEGGHFVYRNDKIAVSLPIQNIKGMAKVYQIKQFLGILRRNNVT